MNRSDTPSPNSFDHFSTGRKSVSFFRHSSYQKGHSLMRRTELSWDKLKKKKTIEEPLTSKPHHPSTSNDYLVTSVTNQLKMSTLPEKKKHTFNLLPPRKLSYQIYHFSKEKNEKRDKIETRRIKQPLKQNLPHFNRLSKIICGMQQEKKYDVSSKVKKTRQSPSASQNSLNGNILKNKKNQTAYRLKKPQFYVHKENKLPFDRVDEKKQQSTVQSLNSYILPIFSRKSSNISNSQGIGERVSLHLDIISSFATYSKQIIEVYQQTRDWEELIFLGYKKFYLERLKVARVLRGIGPNPFNLNSCEISTEEINSFKKKFEGIKMVKQIQAQNKTILDSLRNFYNLIIEKSGKVYISMQESDNFSIQILKNMSTELQLLKQIGNNSAKKRMTKVYRCAFLIAELQGKKIIDYEESLNIDDFGFYLQKASNLFNECFL